MKTFNISRSGNTVRVTEEGAKLVKSRNFLLHYVLLSVLPTLLFRRAALLIYFEYVFEKESNVADDVRYR